MSGLFTGIIAGSIVGGATVIGAIPILKKSSRQVSLMEGIESRFRHRHDVSGSSF